jgi:hypothetical protein
MPGGANPLELAPGLWSWSTRHPEWHPGEFGAEVVSFAARGDEALLLIDPLLPADDPGLVLALLDAEAAEAARIAILITITYHVRSAERLWRRYGTDRPVSIHSHPAGAKRLGPEAVEAFEAMVPGERLPGEAMPHAIGRPRRYEHPLHLPAHDAIVFGDAVAGVGGELRVWATRPLDDKVLRFYRERFNPTLEPLVEIGAERMLMTHGPSVLSGGSEALRRALEAPPWYHRG